MVRKKSGFYGQYAVFFSFNLKKLSKNFPKEKNVRFNNFKEK